MNSIRIVTVCDMCSDEPLDFHQCRSYPETCVHDGINCPDYVETCCCNICFPDWQDNLTYEGEANGN